MIAELIPAVSTRHCFVYYPCCSGDRDETSNLQAKVRKPYMARMHTYLRVSRTCRFRHGKPSRHGLDRTRSYFSDYAQNPLNNLDTSKSARYC